ncbi:hypothetical protein ACF06Q_26080 [Streptomyces leeuwenhoekii]|uniref:hypothetical protein n=1 Tax=Streptomyces leeuwenhoekii TaxID=1437453 RepID=UPI0036FE180B
MSNPPPSEVTLRECQVNRPGLGRATGQTLVTPLDVPGNDLTITAVAEDGLTYTVERKNGKALTNDKRLWDQPNLWYAPAAGEEEVWEASGRPEWYWNTVIAAVASYQKPNAPTEMAQLQEGIKSVFAACRKALGVPGPAILADLEARRHYVAEKGITRAAQISTILPEGVIWEKILTPQDMKKVVDEWDELRKTIQSHGVAVNTTSGSGYPAVSRGRAVLVVTDVEKDQHPTEEKYRLSLKSDRHARARRHLLAHEFMHVHSYNGQGLQGENDDVDEAFTECLARMVTDTITASEEGISAKDLASSEGRRKLVKAVQYNVFWRGDRQGQSADRSLRYQRNVWALVRVSRGGAPPDGKTLSDPLKKQLHRYFHGTGPSPAAIDVIVGAPGTSTSSVLSVADGDRRSSAEETGARKTQTVMGVYLPDTDDADYHLLVLPGSGSEPQRSLLVDCGCAPAADSTTIITRLRTVLKTLPKGPGGRPVLDAVILSGDSLARTNLLPAVTRDVDVGAVHYAGQPHRHKAPLPGGGTLGGWLDARKARPLPAAFSGPDRPFTTIGPARVYILGANAAASGPAGNGRCAVVLVAVGGLRWVLTSDVDAATARVTAAWCGVPAGPLSRLFTYPATVTVVSGRPDEAAARLWPWQPPAGAPVLLPLAAESRRPGPGRPARRLAASCLGHGRPEPPTCALSLHRIGAEETCLTAPIGKKASGEEPGSVRPLDEGVIGEKERAR